MAVLNCIVLSAWRTFKRGFFVFFGLVLTLPGCRSTEPEITANIKSFGSYNIPNGFIVSIKNGGRMPIRIYRPNHTQYFFWEYEIEYRSGTNRTFVQTGDISWNESEPVTIPVGGVYSDSIDVGANDFYDVSGNGGGCMPFLGKRVRLIYKFAGKRLPSENLIGIRHVLVADDEPLKYETVSGILMTNWMEIGPIDLEKLKNDSLALSKRVDFQGTVERGLLPRLNCGER